MKLFSLCPRRLTLVLVLTLLCWGMILLIQHSGEFPVGVHFIAVPVLMILVAVLAAMVESR